MRERELDPRRPSAQAVTVYDADGTLLVDLPHGGFITVIQNGICSAHAQRHTRRPATRPSGSSNMPTAALWPKTPTTGWSVELYAFGGDNKAAFERLCLRLNE